MTLYDFWTNIAQKKGKYENFEIQNDRRRRIREKNGTNSGFVCKGIRMQKTFVPLV